MSNSRLLARSIRWPPSVIFALARLVDNAYFFFAGYVVLQYIVLATAWNILGGYTGYVNFGTAAFFAMGAYSTVVLHKLCALPLPADDPGRRRLSGLIGLGTGYLTLRLRGTVSSHRHAGDGRRRADPGHQLGFRRRLARRLHHSPGEGAVSASTTSSICS